MKPIGQYLQAPTLDAGFETSSAHRMRFHGIHRQLKGKFQAMPSSNPNDPRFKMCRARVIFSKLATLSPQAREAVERDYKKEFKVLRREKA